MKPLPPPDSLHLQAAQGWCELHAFLEANNELEKITPPLRAHPAVLMVRLEIYINLEKWEAATDIASAIINLRPDWGPGWIYKAASLTELKRYQDAYEVLKEAVVRFPSDEILPYELACICCVLQRIDEARTFLDKAIEVGGKDVELRALDDSDLAPLWKQTGA